MKSRKWCLLILLALSSLTLVGILASRIPDPLFLNDYSTVVLAEDGQILRVFLNKGEQWILPDDGRDIPPKLRAAVIHYEDKRFDSHWGIDFLAVARALLQNVRRGSQISGASTVTMQVARLMEPKPRTIPNKLREMAQALRIELKYSKDEIMKIYLIHAPYGGNIIGYRTASLRYFGCEPEQLSWAQAATLAVLPNNPANVNPMRNPDQLKIKRDGLLLRFLESGTIDRPTYDLALAEHLPRGTLPFPVAAPHLAERLARTVNENMITTTINKEIQEQVSKLLGDYVSELGSRGIRNGAVLVTDTATGEVKAYVASQDYFDDSNLGKIDGVQMRRSLGSTLKPFLYALAMDEGIIVRESVLMDVPTYYGGFTPYNADRKFSGIVRADNALMRSLNAPAVQLLNNLGVGEFLHFLKVGGLEGLVDSPEHYGLSLILGSAQGSLWELSRMYRGLANYGLFSDLTVLPHQSGEEERLFSAGSSFLVLETLKEVARPGLDYYWRDYQSSAPLGWKTGTSFGNYDAWAVGASPQWIIGVWVGNFAGGEIKDLSGIDSAAPLLFRVFGILEKGVYQNWFSRPEHDLTEIEVSTTTGYRLKGESGQTKTALASASAEPLRYSPYERTVFLNKAETMQVCSLCWQRDDLSVVQRVIYPPQVNAYLRSTGWDYSFPPHNPKCPALQKDNPISFVYPQENSLIFVPRDEKGEYQKVNLEIAHSLGVNQVFWYLDDAYLGETNHNHTVSIALESGWHTLFVIDGSGNSQSITFFSERR